MARCTCGSRRPGRGRSDRRRQRVWWGGGETPASAAAAPVRVQVRRHGRSFRVHGRKRVVQGRPDACEGGGARSLPCGRLARRAGARRRVTPARVRGRPGGQTGTPGARCRPQVRRDWGRRRARDRQQGRSAADVSPPAVPRSAFINGGGCAAASISGDRWAMPAWAPRAERTHHPTARAASQRHAAQCVLRRTAARDPACYTCASRHCG